MHNSFLLHGGRDLKLTVSTMSLNFKAVSLNEEKP